MVILITGITSGFGKAIAERLSREGHIVYGTHRHATEFLPGVHYIKTEVTDDESVEAAVKEVLDNEGRIDVFINNAGMGIGGPLEFCTVEQARVQMDVNWLGMVRFMDSVVPVMRRAHGGKIICVSSIAGLIGLPFQGLYSSSKFAIEGYCEALRMELHDSSVQVIVLEPGDFHTRFTSSRQSVDVSEASEAYPKYAGTLSVIEDEENGGLSPEVLAAKVSRIVRKRRPRNSYVIATFTQRLSILAKRLLPSRLFSWIIRKYYHM
jgi:NAD(P)-dependent dehydrogenase (short-subunit alcohol dehydrogenase family)